MAEILKERFDSLLSPEVKSHAIEGALDKIIEVESVPAMSDAPEFAITKDEAELVRKKEFADEIAKNIYENGDIEGEYNTIKELMRRMGMEDAGKGRRLKLTSALNTLSDAGIVRTKKMISKGTNGREHEIYAPLNKPGNFVILEREHYQKYKNAIDES